MKKLALLLLLVATPAIACPNMDSSSDEQAPKTAEKDKKDNKTADKTPAKDSKAKAKEAPKTEKAPAKDTAKAKEKQDPKKPANDKVSQK